MQLSTDLLLLVISLMSQSVVQYSALMLFSFIYLLFLIFQPQKGFIIKIIVLSSCFTNEPESLKELYGIYLLSVGTLSCFSANEAGIPVSCEVASGLVLFC